MAEGDAQDSTNPLKKQKTATEQEARLLTRTASNAGKFKILGHLVMAAKRFQATLNPSYTYGDSKRDSESKLGDAAVSKLAASKRVGSGRALSGRAQSERTLSGKSAKPATSHGHKGSLLFRPLAPVELEA